MNTALELTEDDERCPNCFVAAVVGVEILGVYDGVLYWECPACRHRWHRFPPGHRLHERAIPYLAKPEPEPPERQETRL